MDLGLAALGTKMYPGQPAPGTRGHAENNLENTRVYARDTSLDELY